MKLRKFSGFWLTFAVAIVRRALKIIPAQFREEAFYELLIPPTADIRDQLPASITYRKPVGIFRSFVLPRVIDSSTLPLNATELE